MLGVSKGSKDKFIKGTNIPKHSGRFSPCMHFCTRSYRMGLNADGIMIIGNETIATLILPPKIIDAITTDAFFKSYRREGVYVYQDRKYSCWMEVYKSFISGYGMSEYTFRLSIDTKGEFDFIFPEY